MQCGPGRVCGLLYCSGSSRRCCTGGIRSSTFALQEWDRRIEPTGYSLLFACVDSGRAAASSRYSNASARGRHPAETGSICWPNPFISGGNTKSKSLSCAGGQLWHAQFCRILQRGQCGSSQASSTELCTTLDHDLDVFKLTQQYLTTTMT